MPKSFVVAVLMAFVGANAWPVSAKGIPAAVVADPAPDKQHPPSLTILPVSTDGTQLDAWLYVASGSGPRGVVILAHGLPGYESNADLAQSI